MLKKKQMNGVYACRVCLRGWGWGVAIEQRRIHVYTHSRISSKTPASASNLSTLVWKCERV
jgi:hypothetical protein